MTNNIGRNDPCHCGSGRKYKKCCLEKDEKDKNRDFINERYERVKREEKLTDSQVATRKALDWILEKHEDAVMNAAVHFVGSPDLDEARKAFSGEEGGAFLSQLLNEYALVDREDENFDSTLLELYLKEKGEMLNEKEKESLLIKLDTFKTLYEVQKIVEGRGIFLKDYFSGEKFWVEENKATESVKKWDIVFARVETHPGGTKKMTGSLVDFPREAEYELNELKNQYKEDENLFRNNEEMWLFNFRELMTPMIFQSIIRYYSDFAKNFRFRLINKDGDKLMFCEKSADVSNYGKLDQYFENHELLNLTYADEKEVVYGWLDEKNSFIASFYLKNKKLTIETNSEERMEIIDQKFMPDIAKWTKNWKKEFKSPENLSGNLGEADEELTIETTFLGGSDESMNKQEEEKLMAKFTRKHYDDWIDMELPALDGKTPREASKDPESREKLIEILKMMENKNSHNKNIVGFDINRIKRKLGIRF
jgi:hypothetical protein